MIYAFEDYELDTQLYELRHVGQPCKLEPQVFNGLAYLIEHRDRVVTKDELLDRLWPEQFVREVTLNHRVMTARKAIGESGRVQRCIKTIHGRGYRFGTADYEILQRRSGGTTRTRMLRELAEAMETFAAACPLIFVLEDLHWSDGATLDCSAL